MSENLNALPLAGRYVYSSTVFIVALNATNRSPSADTRGGPAALPRLLGLILATSNFGVCASVCDAAGITAIANVSTKTMGFIDFLRKLRYQFDSEVKGGKVK
jgi:hypothetical protein